MKRTVRTAAALAIVALAATACGSKPKSAEAGASSTGSTASSSSLKACMVTDTGGIDDRSFNASSWQGMQAAQSKNSAVKVSYVQSTTENDYVPNIQSLVQEKCGLIMTVGGLMADATTQAAKQNPDQKFAIVDSPSVGTNVKGLQFNTAQGGFLGGYLAAGMSKTGKVATYGGLRIPPVTIYMDGFWEGVQYYNKQNHKNVQVLGWNEKKQTGGTFANSFTDQNAGKQITQNFVQQGADIVFPVAGGTGLGSAAAAEQSSGKLQVIWVDTDGCTSAAQYCNVFLTSVVKGIQSSVESTLADTAAGKYSSASYLGTLANGGTGLAPYHDFASKVPQSLQTQIQTIKQQIISGQITITSPSQPKA